MPRRKKEVGDPGVVASVASIAGTASPDVEKLLAQIKDLQDKLASEQKARGEAEQKALEAAENQALGMLQQTEVQEQPTGKTIKVSKCVGYETVGYKDSGVPILKPQFKMFDVPTYFYKIHLPPVGGLGLQTNGVYLYHGTVYEFDIDTLRDVKSRVFSVWKHDADIHGNDENAFRKPAIRNKAQRYGVGSPV